MDGLRLPFAPPAHEALAAAIESALVPGEERRTLAIYSHDAPGRDIAERYIRSAFFRTHRAAIRSFMPMLLALLDTSGRICGALGYRAAGPETLFLERYLDEPVQLAIAGRCGKNVERASIVELGNFAARNASVARRLIWLAACHLAREQYRWVTFTGTQRVRRILLAFRAPLIELGCATAIRAGDTGDRWGRYYNADPRVMAGFLAPELSRDPPPNY